MRPSSVIDTVGAETSLARRTADRGGRRTRRRHERYDGRPEGRGPDPRRGRRLGGRVVGPARRDRRRPLVGVPPAEPRRRSLRRDPRPAHRHARSRSSAASTPTRSSDRTRRSCRSSRRRCTASTRPGSGRSCSAAPARRATLPPNVVTTYGMTETGSGVVYDGIPLDGVEVRIAAGEVHVRCPMLFRCYRDGTSPLVDGWFATGDGGRLDADGRLVVDGRIGELIITGGENVWPQAVEAVLSDTPGRPRRRRGGTPGRRMGRDGRGVRGPRRRSALARRAPRPRQGSHSPPTTRHVRSCWSTRSRAPRSARSSAQVRATRYPEAPVGSCRRVTAILDAGQGTATHPGCA